VIVVPFLVWSPGAVWSSVSRQAPRGLTPESIWYLPLHALGEASQPGKLYDAAAVSPWLNRLVVVIQILVLVVLAVYVVRRRPRLEGAVAAAAAAPVLFLLLNKIFSAQYLLVILAAGCAAAALVERGRIIAVLLLVAATANVLVYPLGVARQPASLALFVCALAAVGLILAGVDRPGRGRRVTAAAA
jgi:hypothetical protein